MRLKHTNVLQMIKEQITKIITELKKKENYETNFELLSKLDFAHQ